MLKNMKPFAALEAVAIPPVTLAGLDGPHRKQLPSEGIWHSPQGAKTRVLCMAVAEALDAMSPKPLDLCL